MREGERVLQTTFGRGKSLTLNVQVFAVLDEIFLAGEVMETNRHLIVERIQAQDDMD